MQLFTYSAKTAEGQDFSGEIEAADVVQAARLLRDKHLLITGLTAVRTNFLSRLLKHRLGRVGEGEKAVFTRQLSTMVNAGLPLTFALGVLEEQTENSVLKEAVGKILRDVQGGVALSEAMGKFSSIFSPLYLNLVKAGEAAGALDKVLERMAATLESSSEFRSRLKGVLIYPAIVVLGMGAVFVAMVVFVIPKLAVMYEDMGLALPAPTRAMMFISETFTKRWWALLPLAGLAAAGLFRLGKQPGFRRRWDKFVFRIPIFGPLFNQSQLVEFTQTLALLVGSGVPILEALAIVRGTLQNSVFKEALKSAERRVSHGAPLSEPLRASPCFPPIIGQMIQVGEASGKLDEVLSNLSEFFRREVGHRTDNLTAALEPAIMIFLGGMVGLLIFSVIMPIYQLTAGI